MTKTKWESKVGALLDDERFVWKHKCPDMPHAGQAKIDWIALEKTGVLWGVEVKYSSTQSLTPFKLLGPKGVTPLQRGELNRISKAGLAWLAIGHKGTNELFVWEWPWVEELIQEAGPDIYLYLSSAARQVSFPRGKPPMEYVRWSQLFQMSFTGSPPAYQDSLNSLNQQPPSVSRQMLNGSGLLIPREQALSSMRSQSTAP